MTERSRNLLVPVDDSEGSDRALQWTIQNAVRQGDQVHLLHVIPEPDTARPWTGLYVPAEEAQIEEEEYNEAKQMVKRRFVRPLVDAEVDFDVVLVVGPDNPDAIAGIIVHKAQELQAAMVVIARTGKTHLQEFWTGSVTQRLTHSCPVPIIIVQWHA